MLGNVVSIADYNMANFIRASSPARGRQQPPPELPLLAALTRLISSLAPPHFGAYLKSSSITIHSFSK